MLIINIGLYPGSGYMNKKALQNILQGFFVLGILLVNVLEIDILEVNVLY